jgi:hypothetical protein
MFGEQDLEILDALGQGIEARRRLQAFQHLNRHSELHGINI